MTTILLLLIISAAAGVALAAYVKSRPGPVGRPRGSAAGVRQRALGEPGRTARFASVEIKLAADPCPAAQALVGKAILATEAPALPLKDCDRQCRCAFIKRSDRRQETRRWSDEGIAATLFAARERRRGGDRRRS